MKQQIFALITATFLSTAVASSAYANCSGNACSEVEVTRDNGCVVVVNNSDRRVKIGRLGGHSPTLYPGERKVLLTMRGAANGTGECVGGIKSFKADYAS